jgi:hypothetical protein
LEPGEANSVRLRGQRIEGETPIPVRDRYPINGKELARQLHVNAKSLRALIRLHDLVPGHVKNTEYRIYQEAEKEIWRHPDVQMLPRKYGRGK